MQRLLAVVVEEAKPFLGDAIDVGRFIAHQAVAVGADVGDADVVAPDDEDVGLLGRGLRGRRGSRRHEDDRRELRQAQDSAQPTRAVGAQRRQGLFGFHRLVSWFGLCSVFGPFVSSLLRRAG